jgi:hypothetical protein
MKLFLLILFGLFVYLWLKRAKSPLKPPSQTPAASAEPMIQCAHCRVHVPLSESVPHGELRYCCEEHRRLGGK